MGYLDKFARNPKGRGKTEVLTARIPEELYNDFKKHCGDLGLSISEAVYLLVKQEMDLTGNKKNTNVYIDEDINKYDDYTNNDDNHKTNTAVVKPKRTATVRNPGKRFSTKEWTYDNRLPCPKCGQWISSSNFSRHAKQHGSTTVAIFTNEDDLKIVNAMIEERNAINQGS